MGVKLERRGDPLRNLQRQANEFRRENQRVLKQSADLSTGVSRDTFRRKLSGRPTIDSRQGRPSTMGNFHRLIHWMHEHYDGIDFVQFQLGRLEQEAPYWLIQEIGTGQSGRILDDTLSGVSYKGSERSAMQQTKGGSEGGSGVVSVQSQRGRVISRYLTWAGASGNYDVNQREKRGTQQLRYYKDVRNAPLKMDLDPQRITKEIEGKHYLRDGGRAGLSHMRGNLLSMARNTFQK